LSGGGPDTRRGCLDRCALCFGSLSPAPACRTEGFPGNLAVNEQLKTLLKEGASVYACRFAMGALYGFREDDLIDGVKAFNPLDVLDSALYAWKEKAFQLNTWTV
jgi:hypothetical protein